MAGDIYTDNIHSDSITDRAGTGGPAIVGKNDGVAVAAGKIGEVITSGAISNTLPALTTETDVTGASITLSAGVWHIFYSVTAYYTTSANIGDNGTIQCVITNAANTKIGNSERIMSCKTVAAQANNIDCCLSASSIVNINASTTYKLRTNKLSETGTGAGGIIASSGNYQSTFFAVRIA